MIPAAKETEKWYALLRDRLILRTWEGGAHFQFDLRKKHLSGGRRMLRDPEDPGWPEEGRTTSDRLEAECWVPAYLDRLGPGFFMATSKGAKTVKECGETYLEVLKEEKGPTSSSYMNRRNYLRNYIFPELGDEPVATLSVKKVQGFIDQMKTTKGAEPGTSTKAAVYQAVNNVFRHHMRKSPPWLSEVKVAPGKTRSSRQRWEDAWNGTLPEGPAGFTPAELRKILVAAAVLDLRGRNNPQKRRGLNRKVHLIAFLIFQMTRVAEIQFLRGSSYLSNLDAIWISGTKSEAAQRMMPIQDAYRPWLNLLLKDLGDQKDFLFPTTGPAKRPSSATYREHAKAVLEYAGLKRPGECTHIFRATNTSMARAAGVPTDAVSIMAGHKLPGSELLNDHYLVWSSYILRLGPIARSYMPDLGSPAEIEELAAQWLRDGTYSE